MMWSTHRRFLRGVPKQRRFIGHVGTSCRKLWPFLPGRADGWCASRHTGPGGLKTARALCEVARMADEPAATPPNPLGEPAPTPPTPPAKTAAEKLAEEALAAAKSAVAGLGDLSDLTPGMVDEPQPAAPAKPAPPAAKPVVLPVFAREPEVVVPKAIDLLSDVNLNVKIELGRTRMLIEDVLKLTEGAVVELDKLAGDPVDVYVNDRHVARGEVLVLNDNFCVRINEILSPAVEPAKTA